MGNVRIALPDELHRDLKRRAIDEGIPLKELIEKALHKYVEQNPPMQPRLPLGQSIANERNSNAA
jgi:hypothetical protein